MIVIVFMKQSSIPYLKLQMFLNIHLEIMDYAWLGFDFVLYVNISSVR